MNNLEISRSELSIGLYTDDPGSLHMRDLEAQSARLDDAETVLLDLAENFHIGSATWALDEFAKVFNVPPKASVEERRAAILAKSRSAGGSRFARLVSIVAAYGYDVSIDEEPGMAVSLHLYRDGGIDQNYIGAVVDAKRIIHAHLATEFSFVAPTAAVAIAATGYDFRDDMPECGEFYCEEA